MNTLTNLSVIVLAIWHIEGSDRACVPYGIKKLEKEWKAAVTEERLAEKAWLRTHSEIAARRVDEAWWRRGTLFGRCRDLCADTVENNWVRWHKAGRPGCFYDFLGDHYCPPSCDPQGNKNWRKNIKARLKHRPCTCK